MEARGAPAEEIESLQYQLDKMVNPDMPSMLFVFSTFNSKYFIMIAMVLSITVGFDLITREREEGSLRSLLSHPVYRDSVINGKFLAVVGVLVTAIGMVVPPDARHHAILWRGAGGRRPVEDTRISS